MKISKIRFKNIHSLRGEHHIDFSSGVLAESGLFVITGATGSGKSTLLDVITLALYNKVPRIGTINKSVIDGEGGIMTRNTEDCFAEVEYVVNQKSYRSHWSIARNRNNNLKDRKQEITEVATGIIIESGKSSVPEKNEALIGLSYDQFVKAMVLSQGQFSKLLQAKRDERNKLLEDITGAKDYREIGKAVFLKFKNAEKAVQIQKIKLEAIALIPVAEKKNLITEETTLHKTIISQKKELTRLKIEIDNQKGIHKNNGILSANETQQKALSKTFENFKKKEEILQRHSKLVKHSKLISSFEQKKAEYKENTEELILQQKQETLIVKQKEALLEEASILLKRKVETDYFTQHLTQLGKVVTSFIKEEELAMATVKLHEENIKKYLEEVNKDAERISFTTHTDAFKRNISEVEEKIDKFLLVAEIPDEEELHKKQSVLKTKVELVTTLRIELTDYHAILKNKNVNEHEIKENEVAVKNYTSTLKNIEVELKTLQKEVDQLAKEEEHRKRHQSLEKHRNALVEGEACPLCGALEHPFATNTPHFDLQEAYLKSQSDILKIKRDLKASTQTHILNKQKNIKTLNESRIEIDKTIAPKKREIAKICSLLGVEFIQNINDLNVLDQEIAKELKRLDQVKKAFELRKILNNLTEITIKWIASTELKTKKQTERKKIYDGDAIERKIQVLIEKWSATNQNISNTQKAIGVLNTKIKKITEEKEHALKQLHQILNKEQIESIEILKSFIIPEEQAEKIRKQKNTLQLQQDRLITERVNALREIDNFKKLITTNTPIAVLESKYQGIEKEFGSLNEQIGSIKAKLEADKKAKKKQEELRKVQEDLKQEESLWKTMNGLIGDAHGKRFSNFVQDLTLEQLIGYANKRLKELSDRYILDIPTADEADKNDSLKVFDCHQGDTRRSINTLSGGETFMVSLAMAFALSDLAAKNVKIESIFIDEGFGTLDPENLDQAISILEKMQNEGDKSIGVISHVQALKERISTQIKLEKIGSGYSTIEIV